MSRKSPYQKEILSIMRTDGVTLEVRGVGYYLIYNGEMMGKPVPHRTAEILIDRDLEVAGPASWRHPISASHAKRLIADYPATAKVQVRYNQYGTLGNRRTLRAWLVDAGPTRTLTEKVYNTLREDGWIGKEIGPRVAPMIYFKTEDKSNV